MKIDSNIPSPVPGAAPDEAARASKQPAAVPTPTPETQIQSSPSTHVQFSAQSAQLQAIEKGYADTPVINAARVAEIKQAISEGHFKVDAEKVADSLLRTAQELIKRHLS